MRADLKPLVDTFVGKQGEQLRKLLDTIWQDGHDTAMRECQESMKDVEGIVVGD